MQILKETSTVYKHTEDILDASERDLRASVIGDTDSSNISCALSPGPAVKARIPSDRRNYTRQIKVPT